MLYLFWIMSRANCGKVLALRTTDQQRKEGMAMKKDRVKIQKWNAATNAKAPCLPGWRKRLCCLALAVLIAATNLCVPAFTASDPCNGNHSFKTYYNDYIDDWPQTDYCQKCGKHPRIHPCLYTLRFITMGETYSYAEPLRSSASKLLTKSAQKSVGVTGRVRNKDGELWLCLNSGAYIPADSVAFDFDYYAADAVKNVSISFNEFIGMFLTFSPLVTQTYNMKNDALLGITYPYKMYSSERFLSERYSGEQIGNMIYGYASAAKGYSYCDAVMYAELAAEGRDTPEDKYSILLGYNYKKNEAWYEEVSSQYVGKTVAIKSIEVGKYVSSNTDQDVKGINAVANRDSAGTWELFTVEKGGVGTIGFRSKGNGNYLSALVDENKEYAYIQAAFGQHYSGPQSYESFRIFEWGGNQYIQSQANGKWVQVSVNESDRPIKAAADAASTWERFRLELVNGSGTGSGGTTGGTSGGSTGTPTGGDSSGGNTSAATIVSQHYKYGNYNEGWYEGEWSNGKPNGKGKLTYDGFDDGKYYSLPVGNVKYKALYYEGNFHDGWRYGTGTVVYEDGWKQEGTFYGLWTAGQKCFEGRVWHKDGVRYMEGYQTVKSNGEEAEWTWKTATWQSDTKTYQVSYHANGGSGAPAAQSKTQGVSLTLSKTVPMREGYTFLGWAESSTAATPAYSAGGSFTKNETITLYAVWRTNTYSVSYSANGGTGAPAAQTKYHNAVLTLSSAAPVREGYTFLGWSASSTAANPSYAAGSPFSQDANTVLYAVWKKADRSARAIRAYLGKEMTSAYTEQEVLFIEYQIVGYATGEAWLTFENAATGARAYWCGPAASAAKTSIIPEGILTPGESYWIYFSEDNGRGSRIGNSRISFTYPKTAGGSGEQPGADEAFRYSTPSEWARESISRAYQMDLVPGYMLMDYPLATTRLDFVRLAYSVIENQCGDMQKVLYEYGAVEAPDVDPEYVFEDMPEDSGYDGRDGYRIAALNALGIINGVGGNRFEPDRAITREEAAALLNRIHSFIRWGEVRYYYYEGSLDQLYGDNDEISDWAFYDVYNMRSIQVMNGVGSNLFAPKDCYSREQSIVTFVRLLNHASQ